MVVISSEHQKIALDSVEAIRKGVTHSYNFGQITKAKREVYEKLLLNIESVLQGPSNVNKPLPVIIREVEGNSPEEVARLHDEPNSKPA